jgi:hypothetical protein
MRQTILIILCSFFVISAQAQIGDKIFTMIKNQDIEGILELADTEIDLCLLDDQNIYNKTEAKQKLRRFFSEHQPVSCEKVHTGKSKEKRSAYILGKMNTSDGITYRVFIYANANNKLMELRIDEW